MRTTRTTSTDPRSTPLVLGLGSNRGTPVRTLSTAIAWLAELLGPLNRASLYRSAPVSPISQEDFINTVVLAPLPSSWTGDVGAARRLLDRLKSLERRAGRSPGPRWGPRELDIDLLLFGDLVHRESPPEQGTATGSICWLTLPHPRLRERRFVLAPLAEVAPELRLPPDDQTVREALQALGTDQEVCRLAWPSGDQVDETAPPSPSGS